MASQNVVTSPSSQDGERKEGVPLENRVMEVLRKVDEMHQSVQTIPELKERVDQLQSALSSVPDETAPVSENTSHEDVFRPQQDRMDLEILSRSPRRYVESLIEPVKSEFQKSKEAQDLLTKELLRTQWWIVEESIARAEGKGTWEELDKSIQEGVEKKIREFGWETKPRKWFTAYREFRKDRELQSIQEKKREEAVSSSSTGGTGRYISETGPAQTITRQALYELSRTVPSNPDYKKNSEIIEKVATGQIKVEG